MNKEIIGYNIDKIVVKQSKPLVKIFNKYKVRTVQRSLHHLNGFVLKQVYVNIAGTVHNHSIILTPTNSFVLNSLPFVISCIYLLLYNLLYKYQVQPR